jgi:hypothetical protein
MKYIILLAISFLVFSFSAFAQDKKYLTRQSVFPAALSGKVKQWLSRYLSANPQKI